MPKTMFVGTGSRLAMLHRGFALALVALLFRAWIPAGFMPVPDGQGSLVLVFCTGSGPAASSAIANAGHPDSRHHHGQGEKTANAPCPFAVAAAAAAPPAAPAVAPAPDPVAALTARRLPDRLFLSFPHRLPPATGPPAQL